MPCRLRDALPPPASARASRARGRSGCAASWAEGEGEGEGDPSQRMSMKQVQEPPKQLSYKGRRACNVFKIILLAIATHLQHHIYPAN